MNSLFKFGCVGALAAGVHVAVVSLLTPCGIPPLLANIPAFALAFQVTYYGHRSWTFQAPPSRGSYGRMLLVSLASFAINEGLYTVLLNATHLDYRAALILVLVTVAALTFITSRLWVFPVTP